MKMTLKGLIPLMAFLGLCLAFAIGLTKDPSRLPSQMIDRAFPAFSLSDLFDENAVIDDSYFDGQVTLVNVWGSWCVACKQEHPTLMRLKRAGEIPILGVDWRDTRENGMQWLAQGGNPYTHVAFDAQSTLAIDLGVTGAPESFLVDKQGQIRYKYIGPITDKVWRDEIKPFVQSLEDGK